MKRKAGTILNLAAPAYLDGLPERHRPAAIAILNGILNTAAVWNNEQEASAMDTTLTPQGRAVRAGKATTVALAQLVTVETESQKLTARAEAIQKAMLAKVVSVAPKDAATESQMREIREQLRQLPATERLAVYRSTEDPQIVAAIETAPQTLSAPRQDGSRRLEAFVDPAELASAQMDRARAADPTSAQTLNELTSLAEIYRHAVNGVRGEILAAAPVPA
jgi:soluble lytic murein transglycosylase-like protein